MEPSPKYWICTDCAKNQGLIHRGGIGTCIFGICSHCDLGLKQPLTPVRDYKQSKAGGL